MQEVAKRAFYHLARRAGINAALRHAFRGRLLVLCYHGVVSRDQTRQAYRYRNTVSVRQFEEQIRTAARFFRPISGHDLLDSLDGRASLPDRPVLVTFDDGFQNNLTQAAPVLERLGVPAIIHVPTDYIGRERLLWTQELDERVLGWRRSTVPMPGRAADAPLPAESHARQQFAERLRQQCKSLTNAARQEYLDRLRDESPSGATGVHDELFRFLSWDEVKELYRRGFAIGSHTASHPILTRLEARELEHELTASKATIERQLQTPCPWIAYPNGGPSDFSPDVVAATKRAGYRVGFTLTEQYNAPAPDALRISRISIPGHVPTAVFHSRISGLHAMLSRPSRRHAA